MEHVDVVIVGAGLSGIGADGPQATLREVIAPVLAARASTDTET